MRGRQEGPPSPSLEEEGRKKGRKFLEQTFTAYGGDRPTPPESSPGELARKYREDDTKSWDRMKAAAEIEPEHTAWLERAREALLRALDTLAEDSMRFVELQGWIMSATGLNFCFDCLEQCPNLFHAQDELWAAHGAGEHILCVTCFEKRTGRPLAIQDFTDAPVNDHVRLGHAIALRERAVETPRTAG